MERILFEEAVAEVIAVGKKLYAAGMAAGNSGNISVRLSQDEVLMTPTGVCKGDLTPDMAVVLDMEGRQLFGTMRATSEAGLHLAVYRQNPQAGAVIHAHTPCASAFALAGCDLHEYRLAEITERLGEIPLLPYAPPGSSRLAEQVGEVAARCTGAILAEHGPVIWGENLREALYGIEELEAACKVVLLSRLLKQ